MTTRNAPTAAQFVDELLSRTRIHGRAMTQLDLDAYYRSGWERRGGQVVVLTLGYRDAADLVSSLQYWLEVDRMQGRSSEATLDEYEGEIRRAAKASRSVD